MAKYRLNYPDGPSVEEAINKGEQTHTEIANAKVGIDGTSYPTLENRLNAEIGSLIVNDESEVTSSTKILVRSGGGIEVPTYDEFDALAENVDELRKDISELSESVTETFDITKSKNLFDKSSVLKEKNIEANGLITDNASFDISDFMPIKAGETMYFSFNNGSALSVLHAIYDSDKSNGVRTQASTCTATNDGYVVVRFNHNSTAVESFQAEIGGITAYEAFGVKRNLKDTSLPINMDTIIKKLHVDIGELEEGYITSNGTVAPLNTVFHTDYIPCFSGCLFVINNPTDTFSSGIRIAFYGATKNFIESVDYSNMVNGTISLVVPINAMYVRFSVKASFRELVNCYYDSTYETIRALTNYVADAYTKNDITNYSSMSMFEKFAVIGDSYASGEIYKPTDTGYNYTSSDGTHYYVYDYYNLSWGQNLARDCGTECVNLSVGGLTTRTWLTNINGLQKLNSSEPQNLYICALGINDTNNLGMSYIGSISDIETESDTFFGNYGKIVKAIKEKAPNAKIIFSTMAKNDSETQKAYNTAIVNLANYFSVPVIKQYESTFFQSDYYRNHMVNGHPTAPVYGGMAREIRKLCEETIHENVAYFADYTS